MKPTSLLLALLAMAAPIYAEPGLPDEAAVIGALADHPSVLAAGERVSAARAGAEARSVGPYELTVSGSYARRDIDFEGAFDEFDTQLSRTVRLPGKARLDRNIGVHQIDAAENLAEDARHQAALLLAAHWWDWLAFAGQAQVDDRAVANLETALGAARRRVELGDAAQLEADQAEAALGTARLYVEQSRGAAGLARARLAAQFPTLALPVDAPEIPEPNVALEALVQYRDRILESSHEIAAAQALARGQSVFAERTRMDRLADPTFGLRLFSERGGAEQGAGLSVSIPLGGRHRGALTDQAQAQARVAQADLQLARFDVLETANADIAEARFRIAAWHRAREGLNSQISVLLKLRRGQELGETDLSDVLFAESLVHEAFRAEVSARAQASRAITKLRIDSHELWLAD